MIKGLGWTMFIYEVPLWTPDTSEFIQVSWTSSSACVREGCLKHKARLTPKYFGTLTINLPQKFEHKLMLTQQLNQPRTWKGQVQKVHHKTFQRFIHTETPIWKQTTILRITAIIRVPNHMQLRT